MRAIAPLLALALLAACSRSPQQQQIDAIRTEADQRADAIEEEGGNQAAPLKQQETTLREQAKQAGGYDGKRLTIQAEAAEAQADLLRQQARDRSEAVRAAATAKVKEIESR